MCILRCSQFHIMQQNFIVFCCPMQLQLCVSSVTVISCCGVVGPVRQYSVGLSVDVAGFSLGSSYADKHEQLNCCAVAQHAAVWGLLS